MRSIFMKNKWAFGIWNQETKKPQNENPTTKHHETMHPTEVVPSDSGCQKKGFNISRAPTVMEIEVVRRLENGIDHQRMQPRQEYLSEASGINC